MKREDLVGSWTYAFNEDNATVRVFQAAPVQGPSRPRERLELNADGTLVWHRPGRGDAGESVRGTWSQNDSGEIALSLGEAAADTRRVRVVDVNRDHLRLTAHDEG